MELLEAERFRVEVQGQHHEDDDDSDGEPEVGPAPMVTPLSLDGGSKKISYGGALLPGEGDAIGNVLIA